MLSITIRYRWIHHSWGVVIRWWESALGVYESTQRNHWKFKLFVRKRVLHSFDSYALLLRICPMSAHNWLIIRIDSFFILLKHLISFISLDRMLFEENISRGLWHLLLWGLNVITALNRFRLNLYSLVLGNGGGNCLIESIRLGNCSCHFSCWISIDEGVWIVVVKDMRFLVMEGYIKRFIDLISLLEASLLKLGTWAIPKKLILRLVMLCHWNLMLSQIWSRSNSFCINTDCINIRGILGLFSKTIII